MSLSDVVTHVLVKNLPMSLKNALAQFGYSKKDIKIHANSSVVPSCNSQVHTCANAVIANLDDPTTMTFRRGQWGGNNGFNRPLGDRAFDPVFDMERRDVPVGGAIIVGMITSVVWVHVHPDTFAERFTRHEVARDALLEGRMSDALTIQSEADSLTDAECAILFVHYCWKSGDGRKATVKRYPEALEACVSRGLIKRAKNGACTITTEGKALESTFRRRGERLAERY